MLAAMVTHDVAGVHSHLSGLRRPFNDGWNLCNPVPTAIASGRQGLHEAGGQRPDRDAVTRVFRILTAGLHWGHAHLEGVPAAEGAACNASSYARMACHIA